MKRLVAGILIIALALIAVVIGRTLMLPPLPVVDASALPAPISDEAAARAATNLSAAIKMPTISWQRGATGEKADASNKAFVDFRDFISATYPAFTAATTREIVSDYSLLFTWKGSDETLDPVLLMSHMDVVPVVPGTEGDWSHAPFGGEIADGVVWGRGAIDCKGSLIAMLEAAETLAAQGFQPKRGIMFAFGHDEEISGLNGNLKIAEMLKARGQKLAFVSDEGGMLATGMVGDVDQPVAIIGIAEKGYLTLRLTAHAKGGHSSMPPAADETAVGRLIKAMTRVSDAPFTSGIDTPTRAMLEALAPASPFMQRMAVANMWLFEPLITGRMTADPRLAAQLRTTIAPTMLEAGVKENVLPPEAEGIMNFRLHRRDTIESATAHVTEAIDDPEVSIETLEGARNASSVSNLDGGSYALLRQSIAAHFPDALIAPTLTVAGTDSRHYLPLTENVFRFIPLRLNASELAGFHATNERLPVVSLAGAVGFYIDFMQNMGENDL
jgi:carboxypeptidase PM20D1